MASTPPWPSKGLPYFDWGGGGGGGKVDPWRFLLDISKIVQLIFTKLMSLLGNYLEYLLKLENWRQVISCCHGYQLMGIAWLKIWSKWHLFLGFSYDTELFLIKWWSNLVGIYDKYKSFQIAKQLCWRHFQPDSLTSSSSFWCLLTAKKVEGLVFSLFFDGLS